MIVPLMAEQTMNKRCIRLFAAMIVLFLTSPSWGQKVDSLKFLQATEESFVQLSEILCSQVVAISAWRELFFDNAGRSKDRPADPIMISIRGSGCILSSDGLILTNEHVIRNTRLIQVTLSDGREFEAKIVGTDPRNDLAVLRISAKNLSAVKLGDLTEVKRGQLVFAVGNPLGLASDGQCAVSFGIVSAIGRHIPDIDHDVDRYYGNMILSTAPISIGNSGGPLFNLKGEIIGINTIVSASNTGGSQLAFAIPIYDWTRQIIAQIREGKAVEYGYVGVSLGTLPGKEGSIVVDILKNTPASKAGLQQNDLIIECNSQKIRNADHLIMLIGQTNPGKIIGLRIMRNNKTLDVSLTAAKRSDFIQQAGGNRPKSEN
jgi:serine protease Do